MASRPLALRETLKPRAVPARRIIGTLLVGSVAATLGGCSHDQYSTFKKTVYDYINPANSFLDPSQVGRFDRDNPWGDVRPVKWPILEQLDVIDEPNDRWSSATDPTPADLVADNKEYVVGAGDILRVSVYELVQPNTEYLRDQAQVSESGGVGIQNLGTVQVSGLTTTQIEEKIGQTAVERGLLLPKGNGSQGPQVSVTLLESRSRVFSILGNVSQPNSYLIRGNDFRLLDALALARDVNGGSQPGLDYLYVIRRNAATPAAAPATPAAPLTPGGSDMSGTSSSPASTPAGNPLDALDNLQKNTSAPASVPATAPDTGPASAPATRPGAVGPRFVRPLATADVAPANALAQADLDAAISGTSTAPAAMNTSASAPAPAMPMTPATTSKPSDDLTDQAMGATSQSGQNVYQDGKWVTLPPVPATTTGPTETETPSPMAGPAGTNTMQVPPPPAGTPGDAFAAAEQLSGQRVIRIPINALREGNPKYNIVIKPGDTVVVPTVEQGFFYMMGHVGRPGVYTLTGQKLTLKQAVAAAGNLDALAIPRRCDLIRRIGPNEEVTVQVNLQAVFDGTQPDLFLKPNDVVNVGTDFVAPFLAVTRNAYRASYGFGFIYDRNFYIQPTAVAR